MRTCCPPRPAGGRRGAARRPHADVVFVAHTGLEHLSTVRDLWRSLPMDKTLHLRWWFVPAAEVPRDDPRDRLAALLVAPSTLDRRTYRPPTEVRSDLRLTIDTAQPQASPPGMEDSTR
jgi:hypothetical protein